MAARGFMLDELLRSVAGAMVSAQQFLRAQQHDLNHLFRPSTKQDGAMEPITLPLVLPRAVIGEGETADAVHDVPVATLVSHHGTTMETLTFSCPCLIEGLDSSVPDAPPRLSLVLGESLPNQHSRLGTLTVSFRNGDTPEGMARLNDQLLRSF